MKRVVLLVLILFTFFISVNKVYVSASESDESKVIEDILSGISEEDFDDLVSELNSLFGDEKSLGERIISFFTGELNLDISNIKNYFLNKLSGFSSLGGQVIICILIIGILFNSVNIISSKNFDNNAKYVIYFISVSVSVLMLFKVVNTVFSVAQNEINTLCKITESVFPTMFSLSGLIGNFGVQTLKPFTAFLSILFNFLTTSFFIPLLYFETSVSAVSELSSAVNLDGLKKTASGVYKWALALFCGIYSVAITGQGVVNSQYNGISVKILKHLTSSMIPIVGGFLSGGMETLLSSAVLIKNSVGLIAVIYVIATVGFTGIQILLFSFLIKFLASVCQPVLDAKFYKLIVSVSNVFSSLAALLFVCGFVFILTIVFVIVATAHVF